MHGFSVNSPQIAASSQLQLRPRRNCCAADTFPVPGGPGGNGLPAIQSVLSGSPAEQLKARGVLATSSHTAAARLPSAVAARKHNLFYSAHFRHGRLHLSRQLSRLGGWWGLSLFEIPPAIFSNDSTSKSNISLQQGII